MKKEAPVINVDDIKKDTMLEFQRMVEEVKQKGDSYIDSILTVCEKNDIDPEDVKNLLSPSLLMAITEEAADLNLIEQTTTRLPI
jgi:hypothetical protein